MGSPRIYILISTFLPLVGGAEKQALAQGRGLRERSYQTTIITFRHSRTWPQSEVMEGVPVIRVAARLLSGREKLPRLLQKLLYLLALLDMGWVLWRHRRYYDVLHVYRLNFLTVVAALVCLLTNKPMVVGVRSADSGRRKKSQDKLLEPPGVPITWLQVDVRAKGEGDLAELERLGKPAVRLTHSLLCRISPVVVVLSSSMQAYLVAHDFRLPDVQVIPNGVDTTRFSPIDADTPPNQRAQVVVCISKMRYQKGLDVLLQAWQLVQEQSAQARLIIVGDGPLQNQLERLAKALGIADSVEFAGLRGDIPAQLHRGGVAVLPSRWEGMSNALLEAMACSLPCVVTRVSGSEDIIQHRVNGLLVESEDYQGMAQALLTLLDDPVLAQEFGQAARKTVEKYYPFEQVMDRYTELYQRIVAHRCKIAGEIPSSRTC